MSFDLPRRLARSAGVRLSLWFAVIFIASVTGLFGLLYYLLAATIDRGERAVLESYLREYADIYQSQGLGALRDRIYEENAPPAEKSLFVRSRQRGERHHICQSARRLDRVSAG